MSAFLDGFPVVSPTPTHPPHCTIVTVFLHILRPLHHIPRIPRTLHVGLFLGDGVLSTTDNASWREQRAHFIEAFLPNASLASIYPINLKRVGADRHAGAIPMHTLSRGRVTGTHPPHLVSVLSWELAPVRPC